MTDCLEGSIARPQHTRNVCVNPHTPAFETAEIWAHPCPLERACSYTLGFFTPPEAGYAPDVPSLLFSCATGSDCLSGNIREVLCSHIVNNMTDLENIMSFYSYCMHCELERKQLLKRVENRLLHSCFMFTHIPIKKKKIHSMEQREMDKNIGSRKLKNSKHA